MFLFIEGISLASHFSRNIEKGVRMLCFRRFQQLVDCLWIGLLVQCIFPSKTMTICVKCVRIMEFFGWWRSEFWMQIRMMNWMLMMWWRWTMMKIRMERMMFRIVIVFGMFGMMRCMMWLRYEIQYFFVWFGEIEKWIVFIIVNDMWEAMFVQNIVCFIENVCVDLVLTLLNVCLNFFQCIRRCQTYTNLF